MNVNSDKELNEITAIDWRPGGTFQIAVGTRFCNVFKINEAVIIISLKKTYLFNSTINLIKKKNIHILYKQIIHLE